MFKHILGMVVALSTIAFLLSSFKNSSSKHVQLYTFVYDPPDVANPYSETNVKDVSNWDYTPDNASCNNNNTYACKIFVPATYVGSGNTLLSTISIQTGGSPIQAYVTQTAAGTGTSFISNRN